MKYLLIFLISFNCFSQTLIERVQALKQEDVALLMEACGYKVPVHGFMKTVQLSQIECMETKVNGVRAILQAEVDREDDRRTCRLFLRNLDLDNLTALQRTNAVKCLIGRYK